MANVATRLLSLILLLQTRPMWRASELAEELGVSARTIHRYIAMVEEMGIPIYSERGANGGFALVRGYKLPPLLFSAEEATVLYMGANLVEEVWGPVYREAITSVTAKLDNVLPDDLRQAVALAQQSLVISNLVAKDYRPWEHVLATLRQCIAERRGVRLTYRSFALQETCREVDPYALAFRAGLWYVIGYCHLRQDLRSFRVDRIEAVRVEGRRFAFPRDFSARDYVERTLRFQTRFEVVVHLDAAVAPAVREFHGHWMDLTEHADGSVTARFGVAGLDWATGWVLSWGGAAQVLEPPELIARVEEAARRILERYGERDIGTGTR